MHVLNLPLLLLTFLVTPSLGTDVIERAVGDKKCGNLMCVSATVNGPNVEYVLSSTGKRPLGWMGMGFGRQMSHTPMVIMWLNADGNVTLSQRTAPQEVMPTVDPNPPRVAVLSTALTLVSGSTPSFGYTIPVNSDTKQFVIYAYSTEVPSSPAVDAQLVQHLDFGTLHLDLTGGSVTSTSPNSVPTSPSNTNHDSLDDIPLLPYQRLIIAHAIFSTLGFLAFLPIGVLLARYFRTFTSTWFTGHWVVQFAFAGPIIILGITFGILSVTKAGALHLSDGHKGFGIFLFVLYLVQCGLGAAIHYIKPKKTTRRPLQNYLHAIIGLLILAFSFYQVHSGYKVEWPKTTGLGSVSNNINTLFYVWAVSLPILYIIGLYFLPKQFRQERRVNPDFSTPNGTEDPDNLHLSPLQPTRYYDRD